MAKKQGLKAQKLLEKYEQWGEIADEQEWNTRWMEDIGVMLGLYLSICALHRRAVSLEGFFSWMERKAPVNDRKAQPVGGEE